MYDSFDNTYQVSREGREGGREREREGEREGERGGEEERERGGEKKRGRGKRRGSQSFMQDA